MIVIKYGGSLLENQELRASFLRDVAHLSKTQKVILVHGGGKDISKAMQQIGIQPQFVNGRRFTDEKTLEIVRTVLSTLNAEIVATLRELGVIVRGVSGETNQLLKADAVPGLGRVGKPRSVDKNVLNSILAEVQLPVFYPIGVDVQNLPLNINADDFAVELAVACQARHLVFLTDTGAILNSKDGAPFNVIWPEKVEQAIQEGGITGGMIVKARGCVDAMNRGVQTVSIVKSMKFLLESKLIPEDGTIFMKQPTGRMNPR